MKEQKKEPIPIAQEKKKERKNSKQFDNDHSEEGRKEAINSVAMTMEENKNKWIYVGYWFRLNGVGQTKSVGGYYCIISFPILQFSLKKNLF